MTYAAFLALFLVLPLGLALAVAGVDARRGRRPTALELGALLAHVALALVYTTPWDNYLVAARVWSYDPARVLGLTLGWVPLEEYLFFILQTLLSGLVVVRLLRAWPAAQQPSEHKGSGPYIAQTRSAALDQCSPLPFKGRGDGGVRSAGPPDPTLSPAALGVRSASLLALPWLAALWVLASRWPPGTYLSLELVWALPPIALQLLVGAHVLWRRRRVVLASLLPVTFYLCAADALAIRAGVWTIAPAQSLNVFLAGVLPIEEAVFFLLTNTLIVFGLTLALSPEAWVVWRRRLARPPASPDFVAPRAGPPSPRLERP